MRLIRQTPLERLQTMRETASNAQQAETLLRALVVFQSPFRHSAIHHIGPQDMDIATRQEALRTLVYWSLVQHTSKTRYVTPESIKRLFPPSDNLMVQHLAYVQHQLRPEDGGCIQVYEADMTLAIRWAVEHDSSKVLDLCKSFVWAFQKRPWRGQWIFFLNFIEAMSILFRSIPIQAYILEQRGHNVWALIEYQQEDENRNKYHLYNKSDLKQLTRANAFYGQSLSLYSQLGDRLAQAGLILQRAHIAKFQGRIPTARKYYAESIALRGLNHNDTAIMWDHVFEMEIEAQNLKRAFHAMSQVIGRGRESHAYRLLRIAPLLNKKGRSQEACDAMAQALWGIGNIQNHHLILRILETWSKLEYNRGQVQAGYRLCEMALVHCRSLAEAPHYAEKLKSIQARLDTMVSP